MNVEIPEILETIIRCNIHKVSVPDSDISMLVYTLTEWIKEQFLSHISILEEKVRELQKELGEYKNCVRTANIMLDGMNKKKEIEI